MTRSQLSQAVLKEITEHGADWRWIASLIDRALEVGHEEIKGRICQTLGPFVAETSTQPVRWSEHFDMKDLILMQLMWEGHEPV